MDLHSASLTQLITTMNQATATDADRQHALNMAIALLKTEDFQTQWDVAKLLPKFGEAAIVPLVELLQDEQTDEDLLWFVARTLGQFDHPTATTALVDLLQRSDNSEVIGVAATALAVQGERAIAPLTTLLAAENSRLIAIHALAQTRHPAVVDPLLSVAQDADPAVRAAAIDALSHLADARILPILLEALRDRIAEVRRVAVIALGLRADLTHTADWVDHLKPMLWDFNLEVCRQAAIALGRVGTDEAAAALSEVLRSPYTPMPLQLEAVRSLGWIATDDALTHLQHSLDANSAADLPRIQEVVTTLGRIEPTAAKPRATEILLQLLKTNNPIIHTLNVQQAIALSLGQLGQPQSIDALIQLLAVQDARVQLQAIAALKQLDADAAYQQLQIIAQQDAQPNVTPELRQGVAIALREWM
jgi:HEAT repeat protein